MEYEPVHMGGKHAHMLAPGMREQVVDKMIERSQARF
jgi:hypothetical protein